MTTRQPASTTAPAAPSATPRRLPCGAPSLESLQFVQARVSAFGLGYAALSTFFLAFRVALSASLAGLDALDVSFALHAGATLVFLGFGLYLRGPLRRGGVVCALDMAGVVIGGLLLAATAPTLPPEARPELVLALGLGVALLARAVAVPSTGARTLGVGVALGVALLGAVAFTYHRLPPERLLATVAVEFLGGDARVAFFIPLAMATAWWVVITATAAMASRVIYRLRAEVSGSRKLGPYELGEKLGEGGMGEVFRARHALLRRPTAVKLLKPGLGGARAHARFEREVQLTARLSHPNTVTVFDYGQSPDGVFYYAMELLEGASLQRLVEAHGPMDPARVRKVLIDVAGALHEAHAVGLIHRDIKPSNIMLAARGGVRDVTKVLDFGLVKNLLAEADPHLTNGEALTGTPHYMSPEAIRTPEAVDGRSDLYALGAVGYFLLTGRPVFEGSNLVEICAQHLEARPVPPAQRLGRAVPEDLAATLLACLEKDPAARPQSAGALRRRLLGSRAAGAWTDEDAERWWQLHEPGAGAGAAEPSGSAGGGPLPGAAARVDGPGAVLLATAERVRSGGPRAVPSRAA